MSTLYEQGLSRNAANHAALTPIDFIVRAAEVYPDRLAVVHGTLRRTWGETYRRCRQLASALRRHGVGQGDTVAVMLPNTPPMVEAHFGIPMAGAVLNTLNTRLDAENLAFMLDHGEAKVLLVDREFGGVMVSALKLRQSTHPILVIDVDDALFSGGSTLGTVEYEAFLAQGDAAFEWDYLDDEWQAIALNYTSGTTGNPKGVVYHHRGAALNALSNVLEWDLPRHPVYLWTLPMFHCNGWCFPWTLAARAGVNVCLRRVEPQAVFDLMREHRVTHFCGAPIVMNLLIHAPGTMKAGVPAGVKAMVAGAAPPAAMIEGAEAMGLDITHVYGLTEVYGPASVCVKHEAWQLLDIGERARLNARQGVRYGPAARHDRAGSGDDEACARRWRDHGRDHVPRQHRDEGLSQERARDAAGFRRRLVPHRRSGGDVPGRLRQDQGPQQGHHHLGR